MLEFLSFLYPITILLIVLFPFFIKLLDYIENEIFYADDYFIVFYIISLLTYCGISIFSILTSVAKYTIFKGIDSHKSSIPVLLILTTIILSLVYKFLIITLINNISRIKRFPYYFLNQSIKWQGSYFETITSWIEYSWYDTTEKTPIEIKREKQKKLEEEYKYLLKQELHELSGYIDRLIIENKESKLKNFQNKVKNILTLLKLI